ncbi:hypothetical protein Btru_037129 [Bulinus truncatus]|nr:hypothetical protein Btru_037129 [Bulinus truncatus]
MSDQVKPDKEKSDNVKFGKVKPDRVKYNKVKSDKVKPDKVKSDKRNPGTWGPNCSINAAIIASPAVMGKQASVLMDARTAINFQNYEECDPIHFGRNCIHECSTNCSNQECDKISERVLSVHQVVRDNSVKMNAHPVVTATIAHILVVTIVREEASSLFLVLLVFLLVGESLAVTFVPEYTNVDAIKDPFKFTLFSNKDTIIINELTDNNEVPKGVTTEAAFKNENRAKIAIRTLCHGYQNKVRFIASQGPNKESLNDFIRMLWEQEVEKVVKLTNLVEDTKNKCEQYWPSEGSQTFGEIKVSLTKITTFADYN